MTDLPFLIEGSVAVLLFITVIYCIILERRMKAFRTSQESLRGLVAELDTATRRAEEAVLGLGRTTREAEAALEKRLGEARALARSLALLSAGSGKAAGAAGRPRGGAGASAGRDLPQAAHRP